MDLTQHLLNKDDIGSAGRVSNLGKATLDLGRGRKKTSDVMKKLRTAEDTDLNNLHSHLRGGKKMTREAFGRAVKKAEQQYIFRAGTSRAVKRVSSMAAKGKLKSPTEAAAARTTSTKLTQTTSQLSKKISGLSFRPKEFTATQETLATHIKELRAEGSATSIGKANMLQKQMEKQESTYRANEGMRQAQEGAAQRTREALNKARGVSDDGKEGKEPTRRKTTSYKSIRDVEQETANTGNAPASSEPSTTQRPLVLGGVGSASQLRTDSSGNIDTGLPKQAKESEDDDDKYTDAPDESRKTSDTDPPSTDDIDDINIG